MAGSGGGGKAKGKKKVWYELYWPDSLLSHANGTKGTLNSRRVSSPAAGRKLLKILKENQEIYEKTGVEHPILKGTGAYVVEARKRKVQVSG